VSNIIRAELEKSNGTKIRQKSGSVRFLFRCLEVFESAVGRGAKIIRGELEKHIYTYERVSLGGV